MKMWRVAAVALLSTVLLDCAPATEESNGTKLQQKESSPQQDESTLQPGETRPQHEESRPRQKEPDKALLRELEKLCEEVTTGDLSSAMSMAPPDKVLWLFTGQLS